jgi:hypothetical protein
MHEKSRKAKTLPEPTENEAEAAIAAGGDVVGRSEDDDLLVEGPNSK